MFSQTTCFFCKLGEVCKDSLQQSLAMMPQNALVGFITFGAMLGTKRSEAIGETEVTRGSKYFR